ncbi:hypothetical protein DM02DRAFT_401915 [Periconia macrospinosa]|uniref:Uncharacterized protein n=1 Tax=Periconia macrospinosa TaxID=97972 RepID=A0A2V1CYT0_9PLEO|nr:hypothetical protein DM02DRAFT_401915 [Periconia macrospinosa]
MPCNCRTEHDGWYCFAGMAQLHHTGVLVHHAFMTCAGTRRKMEHIGHIISQILPKLWSFVHLAIIIHLYPSGGAKHDSSQCGNCYSYWVTRRFI